MATQPQVYEPVYLRTKSYGSETVSRSSNSAWQIALGVIDDPTIFDVPAGIRSVLIQGRMCGDYYAEITGPKTCRARVGTTPEAALAEVLAA